MARASLQALPAELLMDIAELASSLQDLKGLCYSCWRLNSILDRFLWRHEVFRKKASTRALIWAVTSTGADEELRLRVLDKAIDAQANVNIGIDVSKYGRETEMSHFDLIAFRTGRVDSMLPIQCISYLIYEEGRGEVPSGEMDIGMYCGDLNNESFQKYIICPVYIAIGRRYFRVARRLIDAGANVNSPISSLGFTPLIHGIMQRKHDIVKFLLAQKEVDKNLSNSNSCWPLDVAADVSTVDIVKLLLPHADMEDPKHMHGSRALLLAVARQDIGKVSALLSKEGIDPNKELSWNRWLLTPFPTDFKPPHTAFTIACGLSNGEIMRLLYGHELVKVDKVMDIAVFNAVRNLQKEHTDFLLRSSKSHSARAELLRIIDNLENWVENLNIRECMRTFCEECIERLNAEQGTVGYVAEPALA